MNAARFGNNFSRFGGKVCIQKVDLDLRQGRRDVVTLEGAVKAVIESDGSRADAKKCIASPSSV